MSHINFPSRLRSLATINGQGRLGHVLDVVEDGYVFVGLAMADVQLILAMFTSDFHGDFPYPGWGTNLHIDGHECRLVRPDGSNNFHMCIKGANEEKYKGEQP